MDPPVSSPWPPSASREAAALPPSAGLLARGGCTVAAVHLTEGNPIAPLQLSCMLKSGSATSSAPFAECSSSQTSGATLVLYQADASCAHHRHGAALAMGGGSAWSSELQSWGEPAAGRACDWEPQLQDGAQHSPPGHHAAFVAPSLTRQASS